ncbi:hypothetical protein SeLEV6574_g00419 [Synchytrium endobioticum]|uniref:Uncharacterized protein n=1 Tax=Synchytrium endobioticum TaxID=286115 RepID=A0A507DHV6_9FUNG|nr:hypothetical protein SeLEV6574_g00419 [Synchytrium endobioticum]
MLASSASMNTLSSTSDTLHHVPTRHDRLDADNGHGPDEATSVSTLMRQLVHHVLGDEHHPRSERVYQHAMRILASKLTVPATHDFLKLVDTLKKKLAKRDNRPEKAAELGILASKLSLKRKPHDKWAILYFLNSLNDKMIFTHTSNVNISEENWLAPPPQMAPKEIPPPASISSSHRVPSLQAYSTDRSPPAKIAAPTSQQRADLYYSSTRVARELDLVRDVLYVLQGIDGKYIKFVEDLDRYAVDPNAGIPLPTQQVLGQLSELGYMYKSIHSFLVSSRLDTSVGLVGQSLCSALSQELNDYHRLIAVLEGQLSIPEVAPSTFVSSTLSLRRLVVWTHEPMQRLRMMCILTDLCQGHRGGALISQMHNYVNHGDPFIQKFIHHLLVEVARPFYEMLAMWMYEGELDDPFDEFFVTFNPNVNDSDMWKNQYYTRPDFQPSYISKNVAKKIVTIGKSLNFIRIACNDTSFLVLSRGKKVMQYGDVQALESTVESVYSATGKALLDILYNKYKVTNHFGAFKRFILLGQGDFVQYLMDSVGPCLSKPATSLYRHNLVGNLEAATRSSNAQYEDPDVLKRLDVVISGATPTDIGWDVFRLEYRLDPPLSTVFTQTSIKSYRILFNFLWSLKRTEHELSSGWKHDMTRAQVFRQLQGAASGFHFSNLIWSEMIHFVYQMQYYMLFEVLECSWDELLGFVNKKTGDLDGLIGAHNKYLNTIIKKGLLAPPSASSSTPNFFAQFMKLFGTIHKFVESREKLVSQAMTVLKEKQLANQVSYKKGLEGRVGLRLTNEMEELPPIPAQSSSSRSSVETLECTRDDMQKAAAAFKEELIVLLDMISKQSDTSVRFLSFRLNFNEYYSVQ